MMLRPKNVCLLIVLVSGGLFLVRLTGLVSRPGWPGEVYAQAKDGKEYKTQYVNDWKTLKEIITSDAEPDRIKDYIPLPNPQDKYGFAAEADSDSIKLDTDGDGKLDKTLGGREKEFFVEYKYGEAKLPYCLRIWKKEIEGAYYWYYQRACFRRAQVEGETVILIDENTNGSYHDEGEDMVLIGKDKYALPLSKLVVLKGKVYEFETDEFGTKILLKEYQGATGEINLKKGLNFKYKPKVVVLQGDEAMLNILLDKETAVIPAGEYKLHLAIFTERIHARKGQLPKFQVEAGKVTTLKWGGPFELALDPQCEKTGELITIIPAGPSAPPQYTAKYLDCPFIIMDYPVIRGAEGEEYFAPKRFNSEGGWEGHFAMPDPAISFFNVEIIAEESCGTKYPKGKVLNKIGNPLVERWQKFDVSNYPGDPGYQPKIYWYKYQCPLYEYKGPVTLKVWTTSQIFGGKISFEEKLEIK